MRKLLIASLAFVLSLSYAPISSAAVKVFKNCTELKKVYPGGIARPGAVNKGSETQKTPTYNKKIYEANKKSDRDKDGIACES
jgi:hypothetical protein